MYPVDNIPQYIPWMKTKSLSLIKTKIYGLKKIKFLPHKKPKLRYKNSLKNCLVSIGKNQKNLKDPKLNKMLRLRKIPLSYKGIWEQSMNRRRIVKESDKSSQGIGE